MTDVRSLELAVLVPPRKAAGEDARAPRRGSIGTRPEFAIGFARETPG